MKKADLFFNVLRLPVDFAMLVAAGVLTYIFRTEILSFFRPVLFEFHLPLGRYVTIVLVTTIVFVVAYAISGLYAMRVRLTIGQEILRIVVASSGAILGIIIFIFLRQELFDSRFLVLGGWLFAILFVTFGRYGVRKLQRYMVLRRGFGIHKAMVIGDDEISHDIVRALYDDPASGYRVVKHLFNPDLEEVRVAVGNPGIDEVILANPNYPAQRILELVDFCHENHISFKFVPNIYQTLTTHYDVDAINNIPVIELRRTSLDGWGRVAKRTIDIIFSISALVIFSPLFALIALAIKWETSGPVFARLKRVSRRREFYLLKFRGMIENAEELKPYLMTQNERSDGPLFKMKNDPRITKVGRFIRKYRLDELAQFINVLRGEMSVIGPRPHQPDEIAQYAKHHKKLLAIKAGASGFAQISGSSDIPFEEEVRLDTFYIENWSLWLDFKIMIKTALKMLHDRSAV